MSKATSADPMGQAVDLAAMSQESGSVSLGGRGSPVRLPVQNAHLQGAQVRHRFMSLGRGISWDMFAAELETLAVTLSTDEGVEGEIHIVELNVGKATGPLDLEDDAISIRKSCEDGLS
ncbi:hypothetical protein R1sor_013776 [Riccia sorocarpa]|uniref:Uncharacterized protein n=1 Tax=Riccia sorocarpa TaxID=122646 RepID=A0ABD3H7K2_9MARC